MDTDEHTYEAEAVTVTWDRERCIHATAYVDGLPDVFDPERRPCVEPDQATPRRRRSRRAAVPYRGPPPHPERRGP